MHACASYHNATGVDTEVRTEKRGDVVSITITLTIPEGTTTSGAVVNARSVESSLSLTLGTATQATALLGRVVTTDPVIHVVSLGQEGGGNSSGGGGGGADGWLTTPVLVGGVSAAAVVICTAALVLRRLKRRYACCTAPWIVTIRPCYKQDRPLAETSSGTTKALDAVPRRPPPQVTPNGPKVWFGPSGRSSPASQRAAPVFNGRGPRATQALRPYAGLVTQAM